MKYLVTYDISDNRIREKVSRFLLRFGKRVQLSCFEVECDEADLKCIVKFLQESIDNMTDSVFLFPISKNMDVSIVRLGQVEKNEEVV